MTRGDSHRAAANWLPGRYLASHDGAAVISLAPLVLHEAGSWVCDCGILLCLPRHRHLSTYRTGGDFKCAQQFSFS